MEGREKGGGEVGRRDGELSGRRGDSEGGEDEERTMIGKCRKRSLERRVM